MRRLRGQWSCRRPARRSPRIPPSSRCRRRMPAPSPRGWPRRACGSPRAPAASTPRAPGRPGAAGPVGPGRRSGFPPPPGSPARMSRARSWPARRRPAGVARAATPRASRRRSPPGASWDAEAHRPPRRHRHRRRQAEAESTRAGSPTLVAARPIPPDARSTRRSRRPVRRLDCSMRPLPPRRARPCRQPRHRSPQPCSRQGRSRRAAGRRAASRSPFRVVPRRCRARPPSPADADVRCRASVTRRRS